MKNHLLLMLSLLIMTGCKTEKEEKMEILNQAMDISRENERLFKDCLSGKEIKEWDALPAELKNRAEFKPNEKRHNCRVKASQVSYNKMLKIDEKYSGTKMIIYYQLDFEGYHYGTKF